MAKTGNRSPKLSFQQAASICRGLVPIGDEIFAYMESLREANFLAWLPRHSYIESFAENRDEVETHRRCLVEEAKNRLGSPWPLWATKDQLNLVYRSPFILQLEERRDKENGVPRAQLESRYPLAEAGWRIHYDPCLRRRVLAGLSDPEGSRERFSRMLEEERRALESEVVGHATGLGKIPQTFDEAGRYAFFAAVMERDGDSLGFHYDDERSRRNYPVFSKAIVPDWHLCWALEEPKTYFFNPFEGRFEPQLELRSSKLQGRPTRAEPGELLLIRYNSVVPGFANGYWRFLDLDNLETAIKAHLHLYRLMAPIIERAIERVLEHHE